METGKDHDPSPITGPAQEPDGWAGPPRLGPVRRVGKGLPPRRHVCILKTQPYKDTLKRETQG